MKTITKTLIALVLLAGIIFTGVQIVQAASVAEKPSFPPATIQSFCISKGGTWSGISGYNGECTYPPGSEGHEFWGYCSATQNLITIHSGILTHVPDERGLRFSRSVAKPDQGEVGGPYRCENISTSGFGKCGNEAGKTDEIATVITCQGVSVVFDAGSCTGKCTVGPKLLNTAKKGLSQLDGEVLGQAYVKVRKPAGGSYKICMPGEGTIYKWVSGAWVAQPTQTVNGVSCAWSSGDGNYVLVGN